MYKRKHSSKWGREEGANTRFANYPSPREKNPDYAADSNGREIKTRRYFNSMFKGDGWETRAYKLNSVLLFAAFFFFEVRPIKTETLCGACNFLFANVTSHVRMAVVPISHNRSRYCRGEWFYRKTMFRLPNVFRWCSPGSRCFISPVEFDVSVYRNEK